MGKRSVVSITLSVLVTLAVLAVTGCPEENTNGGGAPIAYICENGTPLPGAAPVAGTTGCQACNDGYVVDGAGCVLPYTCENGTPISDSNPAGDGSPDSMGCQRCNDGYFLDGVRCVPAYTCENGIAISDSAPALGAPDTTGCQACNDGYVIDDARCVHAYTCVNGTPPAPAGGAPAAGAASCQVCDDGYTLDGVASAPGSSCVVRYTCENGIAPQDVIAPTIGAVNCQSCNRGHVLSDGIGGVGVSCLADTDLDSIADVADNCPNVPNVNQEIVQGESNGQACDSDIDDDNDGLIEIWSLAGLYNMRLNLDGSAPVGTVGTSPTEPVNCDDGNSATTIVLCGYELAQSLDFDRDGDGSTIDDAGVIDEGDDVRPYFVASVGGWVPVGSAPDSFAAIFDGNGHTINNLTVRSATATFVGLFGSINTGTQIRNVGITNAYVESTMVSTRSVFTGGLVGRITDGTISASYADATVRSGAGSIDQVGGLVGEQAGGVISASYTTGSVTSGGGAADSIGGLVGRQIGGSIIASNSTATTTGSTDGVESIGGLVGHQRAGSITASYASGNVGSGGESGVDSIGGLVGVQGGVDNEDAFITACYAAGTVTGGEGGAERVGGLVGEQHFGVITAAYSTGDVSGEGGNGDYVGGLVGEQARGSSIFTSYATGDADGGPGGEGTSDDDVVGALVGRIDTRRPGIIGASYGFGEVSNEEASGISGSPAGAALSSATDITVNNTPGCTDPAYTSKSACESATLVIAAGVWDSADTSCSAPAMSPTAGVDYTTYTEETVCTAPAAKTAADTWVTWNSAANNNLNAWVITSSTAPRLRYADYDGSTSTMYACSMFPASANCGTTGDLLPGQ